MKNLQTPSESKGKSGNFSTEIASLERPFIGPGINIEPSPSKSHDGLKLYSSHTKARVSVPTFILSFRISENLEGLMPKLCAIPVLVKPLSFKRVLMTVINRLFISVFSIIQIFWFRKSENNFVYLQKFCIFAACSEWNVRPKIRKRAEKKEFKGLKIMATKKNHHRSGSKRGEEVISIDVTRILKEMLRERRSEEASFPRSGQTDQRLVELEKQRKNLLFLVCRILQASPEYKLRPSELAADVVGDLSCLSQESVACLRIRMVKDSAFRGPRVDI